MNFLIVLIAVWDYSYTFSSNVTYDDNIFTYSAEYLDGFIKNISPYRFPFETHDDLISSTKLTLLLRNKFFVRKTTTFNIDAAINHYLINNQKDYQKINLGLRQSFGKYALKLSYQIIPNYLIRYYRNPQLETTEYIGCEVKYQTIRGKFSFIMNPNLSFALQYKRRFDDYISEFDIYDANSHIISLDTDLDIKKRIQFALGYEFKTSKIDSTTNLETGVEPVPDGAYDQQTIRGGFTLGFRVFTPIKLKLGYDYNFRNYTTDFSADSMHYGRQDNRHKISVATELRIFTGMFIGITYLRQWRNATSEIFPGINEIKGYDKNRFGLGLNFYH